MHRRHGVAIAAAVAALVSLGLTACQSPPVARSSDAEERAAVMADLQGGLHLYESGDYVLAASRFEEAARGAQRCRDLSTERRATTAECTSWLRARRLDELSQCTLRLEALHRKERRADPGLNTLLALGAVAGNRPLPPYRVPSAVHPIVRASATE